MTVDWSSRAEKRYEGYKKSQEARIYSHPGPDVRNRLVEKLQVLRVPSHEQNKRPAHITVDLGSPPPYFLSGIVAYNEHNHLTEDVLAEGKRKVAIDEVGKEIRVRLQSPSSRGSPRGGRGGSSDHASGQHSVGRCC